MTGKTRKYNKVYSLQRKQSQTQEVQLRRQEKRKQVLASETLEVRVKRLQQLRENFQVAMENETQQKRQSRLAENRKRAKEKHSFNCLTGKNDNVGERIALHDIANITEPSASIEEANNAFVF